MNDFHTKYRRLARDLFGFSSLWLAEDHLVYVKGSGFLMRMAEEYKRFRLSEIEAVNVAKTSRVGTGLLLLFILLASAATVALMIALTETMRPVTVIFLSIFFATGLSSLALLLRHLVLGPTCVCDLQTRLTRERIRPLNRYHRALETVHRIDGLIREAQSGIVEGVGEAVAGQVDANSLRGDGFFTVPKAVTVAFASYLGLALAALAALHLESLALTGGVLLLLVGTCLVVVLAIVSSVRKPTPESIRAVLWILLGLQFLVVGIGVVYYLVAATREPAYTIGLMGPLEAFAALPSVGGLTLYGVVTGLFIGMLAAGVTGLLLAAKWKRQVGHARSLVGSQNEEAAPAPPAES